MQYSQVYIPKTKFMTLNTNLEKMLTEYLTRIKSNYQSQDSDWYGRIL